MSNEIDEGGYGYVDPEGEIGGSGGLNFGLNPEVTMTKFEYIKNGGKDGAEGEALDIIFNVNGVDKGNRKFPVTKAFSTDGSNEDITDPKAPEMQAARKDFNAIMTHIMHCFVSKENLITALSVPMQNFEQYCKILMGLLPPKFNEIKLDLFAQWQWQYSGENTKTYLEIPKKMKQGIWLHKAVKPVKADGSPSSWKEFKKTDPQDNDNMALYYQDEAGNIHPFTRNGWFVNSNFGSQQKEAENDTPPPALGTAGQPAAAPVSGW